MNLRLHHMSLSLSIPLEENRDIVAIPRHIPRYKVLWWQIFSSISIKSVIILNVIREMSAIHALLTHLGDAFVDDEEENFNLHHYFYLFALSIKILFFIMPHYINRQKRMSWIPTS